MTDFTSGFWGPFIATVVILGIVFVTVLLITQMKVRLKKGEKAENMGELKRCYRLGCGFDRAMFSSAVPLF